MKRMILFLLSVVSVATTLSAQDVRGVPLGITMSKERIVHTFGIPDDYISSDSGDLGLDERFYYGQNVLIFDNSNFIGFVIGDDRWPVLLTILPEGVKVGDSIDKIASLSPRPADWLGPDIVYVYLGDYKMFFYLQCSTIVTMVFEFSD